MNPSRTPPPPTLETAFAEFEQRVLTPSFTDIRRMARDQWDAGALAMLDMVLKILSDRDLSDADRKIAMDKIVDQAVAVQADFVKRATEHAE